MDSQTTPQEPELEDDGRRRRDFVRGGFSLGGAIALASTASAAPKDDRWAKRGRTGGKLLVRWLGGGVVEIATPDYKQIAYGDAWIWNNAGWDRFGVKKPPEYASAAGFAAYVAGKKPDVLLQGDGQVWWCEVERSRRRASDRAKLHAFLKAVREDANRTDAPVLLGGLQWAKVIFVCTPAFRVRLMRELKDAGWSEAEIDRLTCYVDALYSFEDIAFK